MSVEWFDLAQRLAAAESGRVVPRLAGSPVGIVTEPVAVRARRRGGHVWVSAAERDGRAQTARDVEGLRLLGSLGVGIDNGRGRTLVTDSPSTVGLLARLARAERGQDVAEAAAHVGWWADRADFPGTTAAVDLVAACRSRWVTGEDPDAERDPATWRRWLQVEDAGVVGLFALLDRVREGGPLPLLDVVAAEDQSAWESAGRAHRDGWDWRIPDSAMRAAHGLRTRCDTAAVWEAALLSDPLWRARAVHTGHVVHGTTTCPPKRPTLVQVVCERMDARLRAGTAVQGWPDANPAARFTGTVERTGVENGRLVLTLRTTALARPADAAAVTVLPDVPDVTRARVGRSRYRSLYARRTSWLSTGRTPTPQRREVPLDVLLASASDN